VTKRQAKVDGERNQRKPRTMLDMVTKPTHHRRAGSFYSTCLEGQL
jgi:hypothetical protein